MGQGPLPIRPLNCDSCACKQQINYVYTFWCLKGGQLLKLKCCTLREHLSLALNKGLGKEGWTQCQCGVCGVVKPVRLYHGDLVYLFCEYLFSFLHCYDVCEVNSTLGKPYYAKMTFGVTVYATWQHEQLVCSPQKLNDLMHCVHIASIVCWELLYPTYFHVNHSLLIFNLLFLNCICAMQNCPKRSS